MPPLTPQRKRLTNEEKLHSTYGKTLFKSKVEESLKQTRITDAFPVKQIILK